MSNSPLPPVLVAGAGPSGLVAALTLLRNNIPVRIIEKEPIHRIGQRGPGIYPRSLELFHFLEVPEVDAVSTPIPLIQAYKPKGVEPLKSFPMSPYTEPTPAFPIFNPRVIGQQTLEAILRSHLEKQGCFVELGSELRSFKQSDDRVVAHIIKKQGDEEVTETIEASFLIGTDGAKGVTRKQLGLSFLGETRDDLHLVMGDIRLAGKGIDRVHWHQFGEMNHIMLMLRPSDEFGEDGFQYMIFSPNSEMDLTKLAKDKEALFQTMLDLTGTEIEFKELIWASEFRPNVRMVDSFGKGRVFVAGDAAQ
ncbi:FAD-binding monooxygenase [Hygrophoropsis aurantiaca]|uniref:FAD-binding monooxygenase n=1 Tax=Hygrophoropsis aurantiaca TaxID=72124 RepID=A0ACB8AFR4_9AGAM|nr:FAD-binding monooxygenase [Hygrophoropsis aurantiaca]